jgi:Skp family chaperone for outer membrane proteins
LRLTISALFIALCVLLAGDLAAQEGSNVVYVDMEMVFESAPQVVAGLEKLTLEFKPRNDSLAVDQERLEAMRQRLLEPSLTDQEQNQLRRDRREMQLATDRRREDLVEEFNFRRNEILIGIRETLDLVIGEIAQEKGYDLILTSVNVMYHSPKADITDEVMQRLQREYAADQSEQNRR